MNRLNLNAWWCVPNNNDNKVKLAKAREVGRDGEGEREIKEKCIKGEIIMALFIPFFLHNLTKMLCLFKHEQITFHCKQLLVNLKFLHILWLCRVAAATESSSLCRFWIEPNTYKNVHFTEFLIMTESDWRIWSGKNGCATKLTRTNFGLINKFASCLFHTYPLDYNKKSICFIGSLWMVWRNFYAKKI